MIFLLLILIPIVALLVWAGTVNRKRRRREISDPDVNASALTKRWNAERKSSESGAGISPPGC
jgi:hypothetical protein